MAYDIGEASLRIVPSLKGAIELIDAESRRWREAAERNLKDLNVSFDLNTAEADAELDEFRARAGRNIETKVDVDRSSVDLAEQSVSGLTTAIVALGPALIPVGAAFVGAFAGGAAVLGSLAGGLGVIALGAEGIAHAVSGEVAPAFHELQRTAAQGLLPGVESAIQSLLTLTPRLDTFVGTLARDIGGLAAEAGKALTGPYWQHFFKFVSSEAGPILVEFGHIVGNLAHGFAGLVEAFAPVTHQIGDGLEHLTAQFAKFGADAAHSAGFQSFLHYIETEGPLVVHTFLDIAKAVGHIVAALAPLGPIVLDVVGVLANALASIPTPVIQGLAVALAAAAVSTKLLGAAMAVIDAGPVGLAAAALAALGIAAYTAYQHSHTFHDFVDEKVLPVLKDLWGFIKSDLVPVLRGILSDAIAGAKAAFDHIKSAVVSNKRPLEQILGAFKALAKFVVNDVLPILGPALKAAFKVFGTAVAAAITVTADLVRGIDAVVSAGKHVVAFFTGPFVDAFVHAWHAAKAAFNTGLHFIESIPSKIVHALGDLSHLLVHAGEQLIGGLWSGVENAWHGFVGKLHGLISHIPFVHGSPSLVEMAPTLLSGVGQTIVRGLIDGIDSQASALTAHLHATVRQAAAMVAGSIHRATLPAVTDPTVLSSMLGHASTAAVLARQAALAAHDTYKDLKDSAKYYDQQAKAADRAAVSAKKHADAMKADTAAEKKSAEDHAKSLQKLANAADRTAREADNAAAHGQKTWEKLQAAADKATQKAVDDATQLVSTLTDQLDQLQQQIDDFTSQVTQGLTGDDSLSTLWGNLVDQQTTAAVNLATAQQNLQAAQDAVTQAGADATADQLQALADAQNALTAAQAAADQANAGVSVTGIQSSLDAVLAQAQQFATDLQTLIGEGASQVLVEQIVGMGPQAGEALASQLVAAGPDSVAKLSATLDQISSYTQNAADQMAQTFFGGGVSAMEQFIKGLEKSFPMLDAALAPILRQLQATFAGATGTVSLATPGGSYHGLSGVDISLPPSSTVPALGASALTSSAGGVGPMTVYAQFGEETIEARSVRVSNQVIDQRVAGAQIAADNGARGGVLGALAAPHARAVSR